jgi:hypothetical protein
VLARAVELSNSRACWFQPEPRARA